MSDLVKRIEWKLKEKGISVYQMEHECKLGNGTIKRWNTQSPRMDKLVTVSKYLQLSLDYLVFGHETDSDKMSGTIQPMLSVREGEIISILRGLPQEEQEDFYGFLKIKRKRYAKK